MVRGIREKGFVLECLDIAILCDAEGLTESHFGFVIKPYSIARNYIDITPSVLQHTNIYLIGLDFVEINNFIVKSKNF